MSRSLREAPRVREDALCSPADGNRRQVSNPDYRLFKAIESERVTTSLQRAGARLSQSDRSEIAGLLSGSDAAQRRLQTLAPAAASQIERIVNGAFMDGLHAAMVLCIGVAVAGVASALLLCGKPTPAKAPR